VKGRIAILHINSIIAGFLGGILCSVMLFVIKRVYMLPGMLKADKVRDLSYYGRNYQAYKRKRMKQSRDN
jgi:cbb3-type cytochrome oxidase subunit 1